MPKYKRSLGVIIIATPHSEFASYMRAELDNCVAWNPTQITKLGNSYKSEHWEIYVGRAGIIVRSELPVISIRHGVRIMMGEARIIIT